MRWPDGLLSQTALASPDHEIVLHYSQAVDEQGLQAFAQAKSEWVAAIDAAVAGIVRRAVGAYQLYRSLVTADLVAGSGPGCVVVVRFDVDGIEQARAWVDRVVEAGKRQTPPPGMLAAHFHIALESTSVLNWAEWTDPAAHQATLGDRPSDNEVASANAAGPSPPAQLT